MEIDHSYKEGSFFKKKGNTFLKFIIDRIPAGLTLEGIQKENYDVHYKNIDDKKFILAKDEEKDNEKMSIYANIAIAAFLFLGPIFFYIKDNTPFFTLSNFILYGAGIFFLLLIIRNYRRYKSRPDFIYIVFDRIEQTITLPTSDGLKSYKVIFTDLNSVVVNTGKSLYQIADKPHLMFYNDPNVSLT